MCLSYTQSNMLEKQIYGFFNQDTLMKQVSRIMKSILKHELSFKTLVFELFIC